MAGLRRTTGSVVVVALALAAAGWATRGAAPAAAVRPSALTLLRPVEQDRLDATRGEVEVPLRNDTDHTVTVLGLQLLDPRFAAVAATAQSEPVAPGQEVDFDVGYGAAACGSVTGAATVALRESDATTTATATATATATDTVVTLPAPQGKLQDIHDEGCRLAELTGGFALSFTPSGPAALVGGAPQLPVTLAITRGSSTSALTVDALQGSVAYDVTTAPGPLLTLAPGQPAGSIPLRVTALRCDPHGLAEAKKLYVFVLYAALGGGAEEPIQLDLSTTLGPALLAERKLCPAETFQG